MVHCAMCGRKLTDPESVQRGFGPECWKKVNAEQLKVYEEEPGAKVKPLKNFEADIWMKRGEDGECITNVPHRIVMHSPTGLEFGYGGSGPSDMALNILALFVDQDIAMMYYQEFKWKFVAKVDYQKGGVIKRKDIINWLKSKRMKEIFKSLELISGAERL